MDYEIEVRDQQGAVVGTLAYAQGVPIVLGDVNALRKAVASAVAVLFDEE